MILCNVDYGLNANFNGQGARKCLRTKQLTR